MVKTREAWPNALNAKFFNGKVGVYFRGGFFPVKNEVGVFSVRFFSATDLPHVYRKQIFDLLKI